MHDEEEDKTTYKVVLNDEEQYSIWPAERENAPGWRDEGKTGAKRECLDHIQNVWTDMRPLSLRRHMEKQEKEGKANPVPTGRGRVEASPDEAASDTLVGRLSQGKHPVATSRYQTASELGACIERGFVLVKFTGTRGGTELGFRVNPDHTDTTGANFTEGLGTIRVGGDLTLDDVKVRCLARIDLQSLTGEGALERLS